MLLVSVRGVSKTFGSGRASRTVLDHADFEVEPGEMVAILGRSGSLALGILNLCRPLMAPGAPS